MTLLNGNQLTLQEWNLETTYEAKRKIDPAAFTWRRSQVVSEERTNCGEVLSGQRPQVCTKGGTNLALPSFINYLTAIW